MLRNPISLALLSVLAVVLIHANVTEAQLVTDGLISY
jgi:hypothetical protein